MINQYIVLYLFSVFIASVSQLLLKVSADTTYSNKIKEYLNFRVISAYGLFFISTILTVISLKGVALNRAPILEASGYIYIMLLSRLILKEKITLTKFLGNVVIVVGILIYSL